MAQTKYKVFAHESLNEVPTTVPPGSVLPEESGEKLSPAGEAAEFGFAPERAGATGFFTYMGQAESAGRVERLMPRSRKSVCPMCGEPGTGGYRCDDCADRADAAQREAAQTAKENDWSDVLSD